MLINMLKPWTRQLKTALRHRSQNISQIRIQYEHGRWRFYGTGANWGRISGAMMEWANLFVFDRWGLFSTVSESPNLPESPSCFVGFRRWLQCGRTGLAWNMFENINTWLGEGVSWGERVCRFVDGKSSPSLVPFRISNFAGMSFTKELTKAILRTP